MDLVKTSSIENVEKEITRKSANYHPTVWGDYFLAYGPALTEISSVEEQKHDVLKDKVRNMLVDAPSKSLEELNLINDIQRLGISYHFEEEIDALLKKMYHDYDECMVQDDNDLYKAALRFRLLRQQGHFVSCDVFNKFKDEMGRFNESLVSNNIQGMISLYEAAHLGVHDEGILDEASKFTSNKLESMIPKMRKNLATQVVKALEMPIRLTLTRLGAREYISFYQEDDSHNETLLNFAKLDFNMVQKLHQKELSEITRWWKNLDVPTNFPFARDRITECYFWIIGVYFEPKYSVSRMFMTKLIGLTSIMDDIYDVYGTVDELQLLTDAIRRWDISATNDVPQGLKLYYTSLLEFFKEMEEEMIKQGAHYSILYAKNEKKKVAQAYLQEAIWCKEGYVPSFEEYMKVALVSACYMLLGTCSFVGMGDIATKQAFEWVSNEPPVLIALSTICRLQDDSVSHEHEQEREHVATGFECYMNEYGVSKQQVSEEFKKRMSNGWKDVNASFLHPTTHDIASPLLLRILNLARVINLVYEDNDNYTNSGTKMRDWITLVLVNPV